MRRSVVAMLAAGLLASLAVAPVSAAGPSFTVVADGLQSPRGLAFGPGGRLYVAQAGAGDGSGNGLGWTGSISVITGPGTDHPSIRTVLGGLPSACEGEEGCVGPDGISVHGNGNIDAIMALSHAGTGLPSPMGHLLKVTPSGQWRSLANVGDIDYAWSTEHQDLAPSDFKPGDSNPYGVLAVNGGRFVADAGTNTLDWVGADGHVAILAYFPNNTIADATPTCVAQGPDGALYVGTLALVDSFVFGPSAKVYRVDPAQIDPSSMTAVLGVAKVWASGLWPINGCAFGPDGSFYASELVTGIGQQGPFGGDVVRIPFADPTQHISLTNGGLSFAGGVAVGPDGHVYVANHTTSTTDGQVLRLP